MTHRPLLTALLILLAFGLQAQLPGVIKESPKDKKLAPVLYGPTTDAIYVDGKVIYGIGKQRYGQVVTWPDGGSPQVTQLIQPGTDAPSGFNALTLINNRICAVYDGYDRETGKLTLILCEYNSDMQPIGEPLALGHIPLDPKSYMNGTISLAVAHSRNKEYTLLYFDRIQSGGIKLGFYWVVDNDLQLVWSGGYQLPVQSSGSDTQTRIMDNGHVFVKVAAVELGEGDVKQRKDGSAATKRQQSARKNVATFYEMYGETFNKWSPDELGGDDVSWDFDFVDINGNVMMVGNKIMGQGKDESMAWVLFRVDEGFSPTLIASGPMEIEGMGKRIGHVTNAELDDKGHVYLGTRMQNGVAMVKIDHRNGTTAWAKLLAWMSPEFTYRDGHLYSLMMAHPGMVDRAVAGQRINWLATRFVTIEQPAAMVLEEDGSSRCSPVVSNKQFKNYNGWRLSFPLYEQCGCAVGNSWTKTVLVRVDFTL